MTDYLHRPTGLQPLTTYRVDTGASNNTTATIRRIDPQTAIDGSKVRADDRGAITPFVGTAATLYLRPLDYRGQPATAVASTGVLFPTPQPDTGAQTQNAIPQTGFTGTADLSAAAGISVPTPTAPGHAATKASSDAAVAAAVGRSFRPADQGFVSWAYDPVAANTASLATNGWIYLVRLQVPAATTVTKVFWTVGTAGATPTAGQNFVGLYDSTGARLVTAGIDADISAQGGKTATISATAVDVGYVYFAMLFNAATAPSPLRGVSSGGAAVNVNLTAAGARWAINGTGQTALPSSLTLASSLTSNVTFWAAIGN